LRSTTLGLLILILFQIWSPQLLQLDGEASRDLPAYEGDTSAWNAWEMRSGLTEKGNLQLAFHPFVVKRLTRISHLKLRPISQSSYASILVKSVETSLTARSLSFLWQTRFCPLPIDLGISVRKIPTPENTDELPLVHLA